MKLVDGLVDFYPQVPDSDALVGVHKFDLWTDLWMRKAQYSCGFSTSSTSSTSAL